MFLSLQHFGKRWAAICRWTEERWVLLQDILRKWQHFAEEQVNSFLFFKVINWNVLQNIIGNAIIYFIFVYIYIGNAWLKLFLSNFISVPFWRMAYWERGCCEQNSYKWLWRSEWNADQSKQIGCMYFSFFCFYVQLPLSESACTWLYSTLRPHRVSYFGMGFASCDGIGWSIACW